jgi:hypothetical protein
MQTLSRSLAGLAALACVFAVGISPVSAQEQDAAPQCTAEVAPAQIEAGAPAVQLTVALSEDVGEITGLEAPESGISVAAPGDLPRTEMAAETAPQPIALADQGNAWTIWLNTTQAAPGTHEVTFTGTDGTCQAQVTVG